MLFNNSRLARTSNKRKLLLPFLLLTVIAFLGASIRFGETTVAMETVNEQSASEAVMQPLSITKNVEGELEISGILYDEEGKPAMGAAVLLYEEENSGPSEIVKETNPVRTGRDGKFTLKGKKMFAILGRSVDGKDFYFYTIPQGFEQEKPLPVAQLFPGEPITGRVVDHEGNPIAGATVGYYTRYRLNHHVESDSNGHFTIYHPKNGPDVLALFAFKSHAGLDYRLFGSEFEESDFKDRSTEKFDLSQPFLLTLTGAEPVRLKVLWDDGTPAVGVTIAPWTLRNPNQPSPAAHSPIFSDPSFNFALLQYSTRQEVGDDGIVEFDWMPNWLERVDFFYADFPWWAENIPWLRLNLDFRKDSHDKTVTLYKKGKHKVSGTVRFTDGKPAAGITVKGEGVNLKYEYKRLSAQTNDEGYYEIEIEPEAAYILAVDDATWGAPAYNPLIVNEHTKQEEIQNLDFTLRKTALIHGKVVFGPEKKVLPGYTVYFSLKGKSDESLPREKQLTRPDDYVKPCNGDLNYSLWRETILDGTQARQDIDGSLYFAWF